MDNDRGFYYLHTDGSLIFKPLSVAIDPAYFVSPFVKKVWECNSTSRLIAWKIVLEALSMGCSIPRAKELAGKWGLDYKDSIEVVKRGGEGGDVTDLMRIGMAIFIKEILEMDIDTYWNKIMQDWDDRIFLGIKPEV